MKLVNDILDVKCTPVTFDTMQEKIDNEKLSVEMYSFMRKANGIGLSANQVGINKSVFVTYLDHKYKAYYNPKLIDWSDEQVDFEEGCLSFPGEYLIIRRPATCKVEWQDHKGNVNRAKLDKMNARVWLHEYDHLMGITFQQRLNDKDIPEELRYAKT